jgi:hypothetical protein
MRSFILFILLLLFFKNAAAQATDTLTNEKVVKLLKAGFSKDVLKSKISASTTKFDVSTDGLIKLKKAGVSDDIINHMISKPTESNNSTPNQNSNQGNQVSSNLNLASGIYYKTIKPEYMEIEPSVLTGDKSDRTIQAIFGGVFNSKNSATLSGKKSSFDIFENSPVFTFVFDTASKGNLNDDNNRWFSNARSPKEFLIVKMTVNIKKNSREILVGKDNAFNSNSGIDDKFVIQFISKKLSNGVYEVVPEKPLSEGEYCIMFAQGIKRGESSKVFDFSILAKKAF